VITSTTTTLQPHHR